MAQKDSGGTLLFVGLGLDDEQGISARGLKEIESADVVFAESYTSTLNEGSIERLGRLTSKKIVMLDRKAVEDGKVVLNSCADKKVVLLVVGDPMTATTHVDLRLRAKKEGIRTSVIHGASVLTAVPGILGLQHYKFGRATTIPFPDEGFSPIPIMPVFRSTIIPTINRSTLSRAVYSVLDQDFDREDFEVIVVNDREVPCPERSGCNRIASV